MRRVNIAHLESGTLSTETSRTESRQASLMRQFCERICLIHELRKLRTAKEIADDRAERLWINKFLRRHAATIIAEQTHAPFDQPLGSGKTNPALVRQNFATRPS